MRSWVLGVVALAACSEGGEQFEFSVALNDQSTEALAVLVDGETVARAPTVQLDVRVFDSYADALATPLLIETRRDGVVVATCELYPGACRDRCVPERETASVCIGPTGALGLNTWDCPCDDEVGDWFCGGDCALTAR